MTPICTADALEVGTAGPASLSISAAGLVVVTEVPRPALHIPGLGAGGQVCGSLAGVHVLLAGPRLHVAGVPSWAAMLPILTAHGVGQLAAGPASPQAWAAGLSYWAAGVLVTTDISNLERGCLAGGQPLQASHHGVPLLTVPLRGTGETLGAAVLMV